MSTHPYPLYPHAFEIGTFQDSPTMLKEAGQPLLLTPDRYVPVGIYEDVITEVEATIKACAKGIVLISLEEDQPFGFRTYSGIDIVSTQQTPRINLRGRARKAVGGDNSY